jgi:plastocyanin
MSLRRPVAALSLFLVLGIILMSCSVGDDDDDDEPTATTVAAASDTPAAAAPSPPDTEEPAESTDTEEPVPTDTPEPATEPEVQISTPLGPCSAIELVRAFETAVPVTPEPTPEPTATETGATPEPTATLAPAPTEDRIGYPAGYQDTYHLMYVFDRPDNVQVRVICGNDLAATAQQGEPLPYGSILLMETWRAKRDESGAPVLDAEGHFIREALTGVFMMKKEQGFGEAYQEQRSGEWEYVAYRPEGSELTPPERTNACSACHQTAIEENDFVFRLGQIFDPEGASTPPEVGENEVSIFDYTFMPGTIEVTAGTTVTWVNNDVIVHTVTASDGSFDSGPIQQGETFSFTFEEAGEFEYTSSASRNITPGTIVVVE